MLSWGVQVSVMAAQGARHRCCPSCTCAIMFCPVCPDMSQRHVSSTYRCMLSTYYPQRPGAFLQRLASELGPRISGSGMVPGMLGCIIAATLLPLTHVHKQPHLAESVWLRAYEARAAQACQQ